MSDKNLLFWEKQTEKVKKEKIGANYSVQFVGFCSKPAKWGMRQFNYCGINNTATNGTKV